MQKSPPHNLRGPTADDLQFIMNSWLKSYRNSDLTNYVPNKLYYDYHGALIKNILNRSLVSIICDVEDPSHVYGYVCYELLNEIFILHYVYIKFNFRNMGLCESTLKAVYPQFGEVETFITHPDKIFSRVVYQDRIKQLNPEIKKTSFFIKKRDDYKLVYNPYALVR